MKKYDIYISFEGREGKECGKYISEGLKKRGYNVFFNENQSSLENFKEREPSIIKECKDVIVILSPNVLDKWGNGNNRMRLEIVDALQLNKNVITIIFGDFTFPFELPEDIQSQKRISASLESSDISIKEICNSIKSRPSNLRRICGNGLWVRGCIVGGCCLLMIMGLWGSPITFQQKNEVTAYPVTVKQKNDVANLLYYCKMNIEIMDNILFGYHELLKAYEEYAQDMTLESYNDLLLKIENTREMLNKEGSQLQKPSHELELVLSEIDIDVSELTALWQLPKIIVIKYNKDLDFLKLIINPNISIPKELPQRIVDINKELIQLYGDSILIGTHSLLLPIDQKALVDFETEFLPSLMIISKRLEDWRKNQEELKSELEKNFSRQQELLKEYAVLISGNQKDLQSEKESLILLLMKEGITREEAEDFIDSKLEEYQVLMDSIDR